MDTPYDGLAPMYALFLDPLFTRIRLDTLAVLKSRFGGVFGIRVLEIGAGTGAQSRLLARAGFRVTGLDLSHGMVRQALKSRDDGPGFVLGDGRRLPFRSGMFDAVVLQMALHELPAADRAAVAKEAQRVSTRESVFFFVDFTPQRNRSPLRLLISLVERAAGKEHYRNGREFIAMGGVAAFSKRMGWVTIFSRGYFMGNLALVAAVKGKGL